MVAASCKSNSLANARKCSLTLIKINNIFFNINGWIKKSIQGKKNDDYGLVFICFPMLPLSFLQNISSLHLQSVDLRVPLVGFFEVAMCTSFSSLSVSDESYSVSSTPTLPCAISLCISSISLGLEYEIVFLLCYNILFNPYQRIG